MKKIIFLLAVLTTLGIGFGAGCFYECNQNKIAVVDVVEVVAKSQQVQNLKVEQATKVQEITEWLKNVQNEVKTETDEEKQKELLQKYNEEFAAKREEIQQQYTENLKAIDENITQTITAEAKKKGYKLVIAKGFTIYGGVDITEDIAKVVK
ncbi:MAG: OmpH family outer membrane protein [Alphaproteobacteria bacterium]|nr:OmpH family outer membrane protein [Alphaproteobacteria bacterium]